MSKIIASSVDGVERKEKYGTGTLCRREQTETLGNSVYEHDRDSDDGGGERVMFESGG